MYYRCQICTSALELDRYKTLVEHRGGEPTKTIVVRILLGPGQCGQKHNICDLALCSHTVHRNVCILRGVVEREWVFAMAVQRFARDRKNKVCLPVEVPVHCCTWTCDVRPICLVGRAEALTTTLQYTPGKRRYVPVAHTKAHM